MSSIVGNIGLSIVTFISKLISGGVVYILLARIMNLDDYGLLTFGNSLCGLIAVIAEFGFSLMAQKDIPQSRFPLNQYVYNAIIQKIVFSTIAFTGGALYLSYFFDNSNVVIGSIFLLNAIATSMSMYFLAVLRAKNVFRSESISSVSYFIVILFVVGSYFWLRYSILYLAWGLFSARIVQLLLLILIYKRRFGLFEFKFSKTIQSYLFKNSFSFGLHYIIGIFYFTIDTQLIAYYYGNGSLAVYQTFLNIIMMMLMVGDLLTNVFLPYLSKIYIVNRSSLVKISTVINDAIFSIGILMFVFVNVFSKELLNFLYSSKYDAAFIIAFPLSIVLLCRILSSIYAILLTVSEHQNVRMFIVFITLIVNLTLNLYVIPIYGILGAAYVSLVTHLSLILLYAVFVYRFFKSFLFSGKVFFWLSSTILIFTVNSFFKYQLSMTFSLCLLIIWIFSIIILYRKNRFKELWNIIK